MLQRKSEWPFFHQTLNKFQDFPLIMHLGEVGCPPHNGSPVLTKSVLMCIGNSNVSGASGFFLWKHTQSMPKTQVALDGHKGTSLGPQMLSISRWIMQFGIKFWALNVFPESLKNPLIPATLCSKMCTCENLHPVVQFPTSCQKRRFWNAHKKQFWGWKQTPNSWNILIPSRTTRYHEKSLRQEAESRAQPVRPLCITTWRQNWHQFGPSLHIPSLCLGFTSNEESESSINATVRGQVPSPQKHR